jgi:hypothetical protein
MAFPAFIVRPVLKARTFLDFLGRAKSNWCARSRMLLIEPYSTVITISSRPRPHLFAGPEKFKLKISLQNEFKLNSGHRIGR